ncbi:hypothetical protein KSW81_006180 [Nannochloris sp. 'desiccata']|nr:hypothetical protein KSW81_006180 [Chlorella desiccata (nom. nud.)]
MSDHPAHCDSVYQEFTTLVHKLFEFNRLHAGSGLVFEVTHLDPPYLLVPVTGCSPDWPSIFETYYDDWKRLNDGTSGGKYPPELPHEDHMVRFQGFTYWEVVRPDHPKLQLSGGAGPSRPSQLLPSVRPPPAKPPLPPSSRPAPVCLPSGQLTKLSDVDADEVRSDQVATLEEDEDGKLVPYAPDTDSVPALGVLEAPKLRPSRSVYLSYKGHVARVFNPINTTVKFEINASVCRSLTKKYTVVDAKTQSEGTLYKVFFQSTPVLACIEAAKARNKTEFQSLVKGTIVRPLQKTGFLPRDFSPATNTAEVSKLIKDNKDKAAKVKTVKHGSIYKCTLLDKSELSIPICGYVTYYCSGLSSSRTNPPCSGHIRISIGAPHDVVSSLCGDKKREDMVDTNVALGPDQVTYMPVFVALQSCSYKHVDDGSRQKRLLMSTTTSEQEGESEGDEDCDDGVASSSASKRAKPTKPYLPVHSLPCSGNHEKAMGRATTAEIQALQAYATSSALGASSRTIAPTSIAQGVAIVMSPASALAKNTQLHVSVDQARRATSAANRAKSKETNQRREDTMLGTSRRFGQLLVKRASGSATVSNAPTDPVTMAAFQFMADVANSQNSLKDSLKAEIHSLDKKVTIIVGISSFVVSLVTLAGVANRFGFLHASTAPIVAKSMEVVASTPWYVFW